LDVKLDYQGSSSLMHSDNLPHKSTTHSRIAEHEDAIVSAVADAEPTDTVRAWLPLSREHENPAEVSVLNGSHGSIHFVSDPIIYVTDGQPLQDGSDSSFDGASFANDDYEITENAHDEMKVSTSHSHRSAPIGTYISSEPFDTMNQPAIQKRHEESPSSPRRFQDVDDCAVELQDRAHSAHSVLEQNYTAPLQVYKHTSEPLSQALGGSSVLKLAYDNKASSTPDHSSNALSEHSDAFSTSSEYESGGLFVGFPSSVSDDESLASRIDDGEDSTVHADDDVSTEKPGAQDDDRMEIHSSNQSSLSLDTLASPDTHTTTLEKVEFSFLKMSNKPVSARTLGTECTPDHEQAKREEVQSIWQEESTKKVVETSTGEKPFCVLFPTANLNYSFAEDVAATEAEALFQNFGRRRKSKGLIDVPKPEEVDVALATVSHFFHSYDTEGIKEGGTAAILSGSAEVVAGPEKDEGGEERHDDEDLEAQTVAAKIRQDMGTIAENSDESHEMTSVDDSIIDVENPAESSDLAKAKDDVSTERSSRYSDGSRSSSYSDDSYSRSSYSGSSYSSYSSRTGSYSSDTKRSSSYESRYSNKDSRSRRDYEHDEEDPAAALPAGYQGDPLMAEEGLAVPFVNLENDRLVAEKLPKSMTIAHLFAKGKQPSSIPSNSSSDPLLQSLIPDDEVPLDDYDDSDVENQDFEMSSDTESQQFDIFNIIFGDGNVGADDTSRKYKVRLFSGICVLVTVIMAVVLGIGIAKGKSRLGSPGEPSPSQSPSITFAPSPAPTDDFSSKEWQTVGDPFRGVNRRDQAGWSVSMSDDGSRIAVGARRASPGGALNSGTVKVYRYDRSGNPGWIEEASFDGSAEGNQFGFSVAISGNGKRLAVGSIGDDTGGNNAGKVEMYELRDPDWVQIGNFLGENAGDVLGVSVSLSKDGRLLSAGAPYHAANGVIQSGSVYFWEDIGFDLDPRWEKSRARISGSAKNGRFGWSVAVDETAARVIIGAPMDGVLDKPGYAFVYQFTGIRDEWTPLGQDITLDEGFDRFGYSVSMDGAGTRLAIGAFNSTTEVGDNSGRVAMYELRGRTWQPLGQSLIGVNPGDSFGFSVDMTRDGNYVAIGSPTHKSDVGFGMANVFQVLGNGSWRSSVDIESIDEGSLGYSVSVASQAFRLAVGTPNGNYAQAYQ
jgi:hypothetical protein